jgi:nucleotide-binding universal stress UspA family protein
MPICKRILVPVDLADFSPRIAPYVKTVVEKFGAEVHLLYVERELKEYTSGRVPDISITRKFEAEALHEAEAQLRKIAEEHLQGCPAVIARVETGHAAESIIRYVRAEKIDLIILGTHGKRAVEHLVFGSVAEEVLKRSTVPVLAMNPFQAEASRGPFDFSTQGDEALREELDQYKS